MQTRTKASPRGYQAGQLVLLLALALVALSCDRLTGGESGKLRRQFQDVDRQLRLVVEAAERGDMARAEAEFDNGPHAFLPTLELPLRNRGEETLGNAIFELTGSIEVELAGQQRADIVARLVRELLPLLPRAAQALGAPYSP